MPARWFLTLEIAAVFYLLGSIPAAWIVTRLAAHADIRRLGSSNVGVLNVAHSVARWAGLVVFLAEIAKGILAVVLARRGGLNEALTGLAIVAAVLGTQHSIWMKGAGGRGNSLGAAALTVLDWRISAAGMLVWGTLRLLTGRSFWATRVWMATLPLTVGLTTGSIAYAAAGAGLAVLYLSVQKPGTDDHALIQEEWPNLLAFIMAPPRKTRAIDRQK